MVLFARAGALGDFVLTLPVLAALLAAGEVVDVACPPRFFPLLDRLGPRPVRRRLDIGGAACLWMHGGRAPEPWARAYAFSRTMGEGLARAGIPDVRQVDALPAGPAAAHYAAVFDGPVGLPTLLSPADPAPRPVVVLSPGSGGPAKRPPLSVWSDVAAAVAAGGGEVVWVAGPVEADERWPVEPLRPDLLDTIALAATCAAWLGPDSGPSHLAAAARRGAGRDPADVGVVFQATDPAIWAPPGATVLPVDPAALARFALSRPATAPLHGLDTDAGRRG